MGPVEFCTEGMAVAVGGWSHRERNVSKRPPHLESVGEWAKDWAYRGRQRFSVAKIPSQLGGTQRAHNLQKGWCRDVA